MASFIKDYVDSVMSGVVQISGDADRDDSPYFKYGDKSFDTNEGTTRQVRWRKLGLEIVAPTLRRPQFRSGSLGQIRQVIECKIWAQDETDVKDEFALVVKAINFVRHSGSNATGLSQENFFPSTAEWIDTSDHSIQGEALIFEYTVNVNLPEEGVTYAPILTASVAMSMSLPNTSGSQQGFRDFTITGSS